MAISRFATSTLRQGMPKYTEMWDGSTLYPPPGFDSIASATGTGSSGTITFDNIPSTYRHLQLRILGRSTTAGNTYCFIRINNNNLTRGHTLGGNGTSALANATDAPVFIPGSSADANIMAAGIVDIHDYTSTTKNKTVRSIGGWSETRINLSSGFLDSTSAITRLDVILADPSWTTSTSIELYGIRSA